MQICLMYHDVYYDDTNESGFFRERDLPYKIEASKFEEQVKRISDYCETNKLPKDYVVFTFDDGGKSFYSVIAPILEKYGYKGLFFITTKYIGTKNFISSDEIRELHKSGHIIGSHAHTHQHLYALSDKEVEEEWKKSIEILGKIVGEPIIYASIPNGDTSKCVLCNAYKYGIEYIYTSEPTTNVSLYGRMKIIGRYVLLADNTVDYVILIISNRRKRFVLLCRFSLLKIIKMILGKYYIKLKNYLFR